jgi:4,5-dihydroxyphthalate decarboxylase
VAKIHLTVAFWSNDRTRALEDGRVEIEGCDVTFFDLKPEEMFRRAFDHEEFDVSELSLSNYLTVRARGTSPYVGLPIFPSRKFRHSGIYVRTDRGIEKPEDLKGKRIGVPEYQVTASVWLRGLFEEQFGVRPSDMSWHTGGLEQAGREETVPLRLPDGVAIESIGNRKTLFAMIADGELDALISPRPPTCYVRRDPTVRRLFENFVEIERNYYRETGIFPIMHGMGLLERKSQAHPWLAASITKAFQAAKDIALADLRERQVCKASLPWLEAVVDDMEALMGRDYWPYGVEANRTTVEALARIITCRGCPSASFLSRKFLRHRL